MCVGKHKNNVSNTNRGRRISFGQINAHKDVVNKPALWMGKLPETGVRLHCTYLLPSGSVLSRI